MQSAVLLDIIRSSLAQPTAPFHEDAVRAEILIQLAQCPHTVVEQDDFGNVVALYKRGDHGPRFAFAAHMDHPAYVFDPAASDGGRVSPRAAKEGENEPARPAAIPGAPPSSTFLGGVPREYR